MAEEETPPRRDRRANAWLRDMALYRPPPRPQRASSVPDEPAPPEPGRVRSGAWLLAGALLPAAVSLLLVPIRDDIDRSTAALVLVLPVVLVALLGGRLPAGLAAITAPVAFDVLLTRPYQRVEMAVADDVEAAIILLVVGMTVAAVVSRAAGAGAVASVRGRELRALELATSLTHRATPEEAAADACAALTELLDLRSCRWAAGYHGSAYPALSTGGELEGGTSTPDRAPLPETGLEIAVQAGPRELGRFIVVPRSSQPVSREERLVALTIADLFGRAHGGA